MVNIAYNQYALFTAEQTRTLDKSTGVDGFVLMQKAGAAVYHTVMSQWPRLKSEGTLHIVCGAGNNAGDGYIVANCAFKAGLRVNVVAAKNPESLKGNACLAWQAFIKQGGNVSLYTPEVFENETSFSDSDVIVDALLGTGIEGHVSVKYAAIISKINQLSIPVIAVDIPSGLSADTGCAEGNAIQAEVTVTLIALKKGLFTADGKQLCGKLIYADLKTSAGVYKNVPSTTHLIRPDKHFDTLKPRRDNTNKGSFGSVLLIGGESGTGGAILMAAEAAMAAGAGKVSVLTRQAHISSFLVRCPEVMAYDCETTCIDSLLEGKTSIVVGPGLGKTEWGIQVLKKLKQVNIPVVYDADALNLIAESPSLLNTELKHIFTPHPGEAARLLNSSVSAVQRNRFVALQQLQQQLKGCVVLKGSGTLVCSGGNILVCDKGNGGMAVPGCGDVLSGVIGGLLAQEYNPLLCASMGVWLHAFAGDEAINSLPGKTGLRATELIPLIRSQLNQLILSKT